MNREFDLDDPTGLDLFGQGVKTVSWRGRRSLCVEGGLALLKGVVAGDCAVELDLGVEGPAYPGIVFRAADEKNFELAYVQPHTSGGWDAVQYDPVFNGGNTWQVFIGPRYQAATEVPSGRYITLRLDVCGSRAAISVIDPAGGRPGPGGRGPALSVDCLAHRRPEGRVGFWTYRPAYFAQMRVGEVDRTLLGTAPAAPPLPRGLVTEWLLRGVGPVEVEENGTLSLGRYLAGVNEARLARQFVASRPARVEMRFGFGDELELLVDGDRVFAGVNTWSDGDTWESRGYIEPGAHVVEVPLAAGLHEVEAVVRVREPFGWGIALALSGPGVDLLPAPARADSSSRARR